MLGKSEDLSANRHRITLSTDRLYPGFYDLRVYADIGTSEPLEAICTFGVNVSEMPVLDTHPADFRAFWDTALGNLKRFPCNPREYKAEQFASGDINHYNVDYACLPADYDPEGHVVEAVESYKVDMAGPDGGRVYGWLAKPQGSGPFPAMLVLPGAGFDARPRPLEHARHGYVALDVQVHGQDVDLLEYTRVLGYYENVIYEPVTSYYFYNLYLRAAQALRYLAERPDVDTSRIVVVGGSQGGRLGLILAALDGRISAVVSCIAHSSNQPYLEWAVKSRCNTSIDGMESALPPYDSHTPANRCLPYYDPMNFAPDIHCPVLMNAGLIDPVSPPSSVWAVYNHLGTKHKQMVALPGLAHDWSAAFDRYAWQWLRRLERGDTTMSTGALIHRSSTTKCSLSLNVKDGFPV
jgi:cephalosporin-C deacetylase-like acetyl esterase